MLSSAFEASRRNRTFLRAVDETLAGRGDRIKAYVIGTNVLQRDEAFDPQSDSIVRIEASRLWRSLSAIICSQGRTTRYGSIFRSGATSPGFSACAAYGIKTHLPKVYLGRNCQKEPPIIAGRRETRTRFAEHSHLPAHPCSVPGRPWRSTRYPSRSRSASGPGTARPDRRPSSQPRQPRPFDHRVAVRQSQR
jgi:hypothetical protein